MRSLGLAVLIGLVTWGGIEGYGNLRAAGLVESLNWRFVNSGYVQLSDDTLKG